jgi:hydrophobe/amphiphile efflux-1 (HAE1) family protein
MSEHRPPTQVAWESTFIQRVFARLLGRPASVILITLGIALFGAMAFRDMPVATMPEVEYPTIVVEAQLPGASAETVAATLTAPLERSLHSVPGLVSMNSASSLGRSDLILQFSLDRSLDAAVGDVQAAISNAARDLPTHLPNAPQLRKENPTNASLVFLSFRSDVLTPEQVSTVVETIAAPMLRSVAGVGGLAFYGRKKRAVNITVDPDRLAARQLTLEAVRRAIDENSVNRPKGVFQSAHRRTIISANDQLIEPRQFAELVIAQQGAALTRLKDVADVTEGAEDPDSLGLVDGKAAVIVGVRRASGANTLATVRAVRALDASLRAALPPTITLDYLADRSISVHESVRDVEFTLGLTVLLVSVTVLVFLQSWRAAAVAAAVIPVSILFAFVAMWMAGFSLNNISLMALTISVGLVVDDAVVVIENTMKRIEDRVAPDDAALASLSDVGLTVLTITVSLIAAFVPLLFMGGLTGRLFREFSVTLAVAVAVSGVTSVTLTPVLCKLLLRPRDTSFVPPIDSRQGILARAYASSLGHALTHYRVTLIGLAALVAATLYLYVSIPKGFIPEQDTRQINGGLIAPPDASPQSMARRMREAMALISSDPEVAHVIGTASGSTVFFLVDLVPKSPAGVSSREFIARVQAAAARRPALGLFLQARQELVLGSVTGRSQYEYTVAAHDAEVLRTWVPRLVEKVRAVEGVTNVDVDGLGTVRQVAFEIDRLRAVEAGITVEQIDDALFDAFGVRKIKHIHTDTDQYPVILRLGGQDGTDESAISRIFVSGRNGALVSVLSLAKARVGESAEVVHHKGSMAAATITFDLAAGTSLTKAFDDIVAAEHSMERPPGLRTYFVGGASEFQKTLAEQPLLLAVAVMLMWIVLGMLYGSFVHPITILSTLPSAGVGALLVLLLCGRPLDMMSFVGVILLIGIVKKNAIMVVDCALAIERRCPDRPLRDIILEASQQRLRPILMTTFAAAAGALPLALDTGMGGELRRSLGIAVLGGLVASQVLTLYTVPAFHFAVASWRESLGRQRRLRPRSSPR